MNYLFKIISALCALFFAACVTTKQSQGVKKKSISNTFQFKKQKGKVYFNILQLNDVYEISTIQGGKFGGLARVTTIHKQLLKENPNTMLVLAGDFLNPSLYGSIKYKGKPVKGKQIVEVMNAMNLDLVAFGNHEFDVKEHQLQERLNESNFDWVSANVLHNVNGKTERFFKIKNGKKQDVYDTYVKAFGTGTNKVKVGIISVCIPSNPKPYVTYQDMYIQAKKSYTEVKQNSDIVLGLTHLDIEQDIEIAKLLPEIPLIMGGHEHTNDYKKIGNVNIAKADANAKTVYIHRFEYDPSTKHTKVKSELVTVDESIKEDPEVLKVVKKWEQILLQKIKAIIPNPYDVIYNTAVPLDGRDTPIRSTQTNLGEIVTKSMSEAYNNQVDCALVNGGSIRIDDQLINDITPIDIFRVLPYGGAIFKVELKGSLLKKVLNYGFKASGTGAYLQRFNVKKQDNIWLIQNKPIDVDKTYKVAFSDYLLKGYDIPFLKKDHPEVLKVYEPSKDEVPFDIRKAIVAYLKQL